MTKYVYEQVLIVRMSIIIMSIIVIIRFVLYINLAYGAVSRSLCEISFAIDCVYI